MTDRQRTTRKQSLAPGCMADHAHARHHPRLQRLPGDLGAVDARYDVAASTAAGALDFIVVDDTPTAQRCVELLRKRGLGVATFLLLDKQAHLAKRAAEKARPPEGKPPGTLLLGGNAQAGAPGQVRCAESAPERRYPLEHLKKAVRCFALRARPRRCVKHPTVDWIVACQTVRLSGCGLRGHRPQVFSKVRVSCAAGATRLYDLVRPRDERLRVAFFHAFSDTLVAGDLEQASRIAYGADRRWSRVVTLQVRARCTAWTSATQIAWLLGVPKASP